MHKPQKTFSFFYLPLIVFSLFYFGATLDAYSQSEEDILNSIGSELENESEKKKNEERIEKEYNSIKSKAESAYKSKNYEKAKGYYQNMLELKPESDFAKSRLALIDQKIAAEKQAKLQGEYDALIKSADALLAAEKFADATSKYAQASKLIPSEDYPKTQLSKITELQAAAVAAKEAALKQQKYDEAIVKADKAKEGKNWEEAKTQYAIAKKIQPENAYPAQQLLLIDKLKKEEEEKAAQMAIDKKYQFLIESADQLLADKKWEEAKAKYKLASETKPSEAYAATQYKAVDGLKAAYLAAEKKAAQEKQYAQIILAADELTNANKWQEANSKYAAALEVIPNDAYATSQIKKNKESIAKKQAEEEALKAKETEFQNQIKKGENALANKKFDVAIEAFVTAQSLKPQDNTVAKLVSEAKASKKAAEELAMKEKAELEAREKLQKQFEGALAAGDLAAQQENWEAAKQQYKIAQDLQVDSEQVAKKISDLEVAIAAQKAKEEAEAARIAEEKRLEEARKAEEARLAAEAEAARKAEEERLAAEALAAEKARQEELARAEKEAAEQAEKERIAKEELAAAQAAEAEAKRLADEKLAAEAAALASAKKEEQARLEKEAAEKAEQERIALAELAAAETAAKEAERLEKERIEAELAAKKLANEQKKQAEAEEQARLILAEKNTKFDLLVNQYQTAIAASNFDEAAQKISEAQALQLNKPELAQMEKELNSLIAASQAEAAAEAAKMAQEKKQNEQYDLAVANGNKKMELGDLSGAKKEFETAKGLKPNESLPDVKLSEIAQIILADQRAKEAQQQELKASFDAKMSEAESLISAKKWEESLLALEGAKSIFPENPHPAKRIAFVQNEQAKERELEEAKIALEKDFEDRMKNGQASLDNNKFAEAKRYFMGASKMKPDAELPKEKLVETQTKWDAFNAEEKRAAAEKMAAELEENYSGFINSGDQALLKNMWGEAIKSYQGALNLKPNEPYATQKLTEAKEGQRLAMEKAEEERRVEEARIKAAEEERLRKEKEAAEALALKEEYANQVNVGKLAMQEGRYAEAVKAFSRALKLQEGDPEMERLLAQAQQKYEVMAAERAAAEAERRRLAAIELKKRQEAARKEREAYLAELNKNSPEELAKRYPNGITQEVEEINDQIVTKSIIVEDGKGRYLIKFDYPWGEKFYYLNGKKIREDSYQWDIKRYKF